MSRRHIWRPFSIARGPRLWRPAHLAFALTLMLREGP